MKEGYVRFRWLPRLIICILIPVAVGMLSFFFTRDAMDLFDNIKKPPLAPPPWLFSVAWTILYVLMGIGSFALSMSTQKGKKMLLVIYAVQLFFNYLWSPIFFLWERYWFALVWLVVMLLMIIFMTVKSAKVSVIAMICFMPYVVWCMFATYLNLGIAILN